MNQTEQRIINAIKSRPWTRGELLDEHGCSCAVGSVLLDYGVKPETINMFTTSVHITEQELQELVVTLNCERYFVSYNYYELMPMLTGYGDQVFWKTVMIINDSSKDKDDAIDGITDLMEGKNWIPKMKIL